MSATLAWGRLRDSREWLGLQRGKAMATMSGTTFSMRETAATCKACGKEIVAEIAVEVTDTKDSDDKARVIMGGKITGMRISHDCMPKVTR